MVSGYRAGYVTSRLFTWVVKFYLAGKFINATSSKAAKLAKPTFIVVNFVRGFSHGSLDEVVETFTDAEITCFKDTANLLDRCQPWENHLKGDAYDEINRALKKGNYEKAPTAVNEYATQTADPFSPLC